MSSPAVTGFYHEKSGSIAYLAECPNTKHAVVIDAVMDFDETRARTHTTAADEIVRFVEERGLIVDYVLDTHPHADHLMAAAYLAERFDAPTAIGEHVCEIQSLWKDIYNWPADFPTDGRQWDRLFAHGERFEVGDVDFEVIHSPGHTLASITYACDGVAFVHDTLFQPDFGTARCDFPGGDASQLFRTIQRLLELPGGTRVFTGHDYRPGGREARWESTVAEQRESNVHLKDQPSESAFVAMRNARDESLGSLPQQMVFALQVNLRGGRLPAPEDNGVAYLRVPVNQL